MVGITEYFVPVFLIKEGFNHRVVEMNRLLMSAQLAQQELVSP